MMPGDSRFSEWLKITHSKWQAYCSFCQKSFDISNMGVIGLASHAVSCTSNIGAAFFGKSNTGKAQTNEKDPASKESQKSQRKMGSILAPISTLRAEILWTLKIASSILPQIVFGIEGAFRSMFTDTEIVSLSNGARHNVITL